MPWRWVLIHVIPALYALTGLTGCYFNLEQDRLGVALLNQPYDQAFQVNDDNDFWSDYFTVADGGVLPAGLGVTSNARLIGTPTQLGHFDFHVSVYSYDQGFFNDFDNDGYDDGEWFTVFVTEPGSNDDCPSPQDVTTNELYLCAGDVIFEALEEGDELSLDIQYFANWFSTEESQVSYLDFTLAFDPVAFTLDSDLLNSQTLREAATQAGATVSFEPGAGSVRVKLTANSDTFRFPGRLLDLTLTVAAAQEAGTFPVTVTLNDANSQNEGRLPDFLTIDGSVTGEESGIEAP